MNSPAHIKGFVGAAGADLKTDEHVHVATDFMGHFLYLVAVDGDSMLATSAFLIHTVKITKRSWKPRDNSLKF